MFAIECKAKTYFFYLKILDYAILPKLAPFLSYHLKPKRRKNIWLSLELNLGEQAPQADTLCHGIEPLCYSMPWPLCLYATLCHGLYATLCHGLSGPTKASSLYQTGFSTNRCEDLAEIIWLNRQQIRQLEMIQEGLNIPSQDMTLNILPELSDGLTMLLDSLVKR